MIKKSIQDAINSQIVKEMYSSNLYLSMASYYADNNLNGFANWMRVQADEELQHAMKFFDYLLDRGGRPVVGAIDAPQTEWKNALDVFEHALKHEQYVTEEINKIADLAIDERDHATTSFLKWFIDEQVEEEATTGEIVDRLKLVGDNSNGLFMLDNELKARQMVAEE
jgi:ferritin